MAERTPHLSLSQFDPEDRPSWTDDYNRDMRRLDTAVFDAQSEATEAKQSATVNGQSIREINSSIETINEETSAIKRDITGIENSIEAIGNATSTLWGEFDVRSGQQSASVKLTNKMNSTASMPLGVVSGTAIGEVDTANRRFKFAKSGRYMITARARFYDLTLSSGAQAEPYDLGASIAMTYTGSYGEMILVSANESYNTMEEVARYIPQLLTSETAKNQTVLVMPSITGYMEAGRWARIKALCNWIPNNSSMSGTLDSMKVSMVLIDDSEPPQ